jgi:hypothetical protein
MLVQVFMSTCYPRQRHLPFSICLSELLSREQRCSSLIEPTDYKGSISAFSFTERVMFRSTVPFFASYDSNVSVIREKHSLKK